MTLDVCSQSASSLLKKAIHINLCLYNIYICGRYIVHLKVNRKIKSINSTENEYTGSQISKIP